MHLSLLNFSHMLIFISYTSDFVMIELQVSGLDRFILNFHQFILVVIQSYHTLKYLQLSVVS